jgi:hypothetical protein
MPTWVVRQALALEPVAVDALRHNERWVHVHVIRHLRFEIIEPTRLGGGSIVPSGTAPRPVAKSAPGFSGLSVMGRPWSSGGPPWGSSPPYKPELGCGACELNLQTGQR